MKRIIALVLLLSMIFITSCSADADARELLLTFCNEYPMSVEILSSLADEGEDGYVTDDVRAALFDGYDRLPDEYALALYGRVDTVMEAGVFITDSADERMALYELLQKRIDLLSSLVDGEGFIKNYHGTFVYAFVGDRARAEKLFDAII